jgi:predicted enzyme related to lactoylglutathione lyase
MPRVVQFEIAADDPERAARFYEQALGWRIERWGEAPGYWLVSTGDRLDSGIDGVIRDRAVVRQSTINTVLVRRLEDAIESIREAGGSVPSDIQSIPGVGRLVYAFDTEGNRLGLIEEAREPAASGLPGPRIV